MSDGKVFDLTSISGTLGMPAATHDYGWAQSEFGDQPIGQDSWYTIIRKLGWGMHSSN